MKQDSSKEEYNVCERKDSLTVDLAMKQDLLEEIEAVGKGEITGGSLIKVDVEVGGIPVETVIDTGATHSCINGDLYNRLVESKGLQGELPVTSLQLTTAVGKKKIKVKKQVWVHVVWNSRGSDMKCLVVPGLFAQMLLGLDWLRTSRIMIDCGLGIMAYPHVEQKENYLCVTPTLGEKAGEKTEVAAIEGQKAVVSTVMAEDKGEMSVPPSYDLGQRKLKEDSKRREKLWRTEQYTVLNQKVAESSSDNQRRNTFPLTDSTWTLRKEKWKEK